MISTATVVSMFTAIRTSMPAAVYKLRIAGREIDAILTDHSVAVSQTPRGVVQEIEGNLRWLDTESGGAAVTDYQLGELKINDKWLPTRLRRPRLTGGVWRAELEAEYGT